MGRFQSSLSLAAQILRASQLEPLGDPAQPRRVLLDVVHLRDLRRGVPKQIRDLPRRQRADRAVGLLDAVDEVRGKRVANRVQAFLLDACRFEDAVVTPAEVYRARVVAVLAGDERRVLTEVPLRAQVEDGVDRRLVQRHVALAGRALELADLDLSAARELRAVAPGHLLHAALEVEDFAVEINVAVEETQHLARPQPGVEHESVGRGLLVDTLAVAPCAIALCLELFNLLRRERRDSLERGLVLLALRGEEVRLLDHRHCGHRVLLNQFLLRQIAEVVS